MWGILLVLSLYMTSFFLSFPRKNIQLSEQNQPRNIKCRSFRLCFRGEWQRGEKLSRYRWLQWYQCSVLSFFLDSRFSGAWWFFFFFFSKIRVLQHCNTKHVVCLFVCFILFSLLLIATDLLDVCPLKCGLHGNQNPIKSKSALQ